MKYSESLKKNKDFQQVYRHGTSKSKSVSGDVRTG